MLRDISAELSGDDGVDAEHGPDLGMCQPRRLLHGQIERVLDVGPCPSSEFLGQLAA